MTAPRAACGRGRRVLKRSEKTRSPRWPSSLAPTLLQRFARRHVNARPLLPYPFKQKRSCNQSNPNDRNNYRQLCENYNLFAPERGKSFGHTAVVLGFASEVEVQARCGRILADMGRAPTPFGEGRRDLHTALRSAYIAPIRLARRGRPDVWLSRSEYLVFSSSRTCRLARG